jgi:hypothetical protein
MIQLSPLKKQLSKGKVIGMTAGRYLVQVGQGTVMAYSKSKYIVGDSVVLALMDKTFQIISDHRMVSRQIKEVYIDG